MENCPNEKDVDATAGEDSVALKRILDQARKIEPFLVMHP
jgi:hypothetical protein